jgi:hypothetical protein
MSASLMFKGYLGQHVTAAFTMRTHHLRVELSLDNRRIAAMIFRRAGIQDTNLPPKPSPHLDVEWFQTKVASIPVDTQRLRNAHSQSGQRPNLPRIVVTPE